MIAVEGQLTMDDLLKQDVDPELIKLQKRYAAHFKPSDRWDPYSSLPHILYDLDTKFFGSADPAYLDLKQKLITGIDTEGYLDLYEPHRMDEFYGYPRFASGSVKAYITARSARMPDKQYIPRRNPKHDHMTEKEFSRFIMDGLAKKWEAEKQEAI